MTSKKIRILIYTLNFKLEQTIFCHSINDKYQPFRMTSVKFIAQPQNPIFTQTVSN